MTHRSLLLPGESFNDMMDALNKASSPEERKRIASDRMKANGWTREKEEVFRDNAAACGFILGSHRTKPATVETPIADRYKTRLPPGAVGTDLRAKEQEREILPDKPEQD